VLDDVPRLVTNDAAYLMRSPLPRRASISGGMKKVDWLSTARPPARDLKESCQPPPLQRDAAELTTELATIGSPDRTGSPVGPDRVASLEIVRRAGRSRGSLRRPACICTQVRYWPSWRIFGHPGSSGALDAAVSRATRIRPRSQTRQQRADAAGYHWSSATRTSFSCRELLGWLCGQPCRPRRRSCDGAR
jgi:hypothetical protein